MSDRLTTGSFECSHLEIGIQSVMKHPSIPQNVLNIFPSRGSKSRLL